MTAVTVLRHDGPWTGRISPICPTTGCATSSSTGRLVSAAPTKLHQRVLGNLYVLLRAACPADLEVFLAPTDYQPTSTRSFQPDLLVVTRDDPGDAAVTTPLAIAVEVLSPSSRSIDTVLKRELSSRPKSRSTGSSTRTSRRSRCGREAMPASAKRTPSWGTPRSSSRPRCRSSSVPATSWAESGRRSPPGRQPSTVHGMRNASRGRAS